MVRRRIGLFGGTFDPVHSGHFLVAQAAMEEAQLDRLFFIPAARSPFKESSIPSSGEDRLKWLRLSLSGQSRFEVDSSEVQRGGVSFAIDTVRSYQSRFPDAQLCYLIGADHIEKLLLWREAVTLAESLEFLVVPRPGEKKASLPEPFKGSYLSGFPCQISASMIRERVRMALPISGLVSSFVEEDIVNRRIYR
ncbi:MAG: nicotinate (nicotinamide) nucleotide adenylyltransferase [Verrucomicrobia bacterium]|jgi:nicotinate-nucleotide adenylyltransferase|nr:nicotinate (nicotinamide) nucleotide adenylyltransferase [Verrucomicrobiota bacterium]